MLKSNKQFLPSILKMIFIHYTCIFGVIWLLLACIFVLILFGSRQRVHFMYSSKAVFSDTILFMHSEMSIFVCPFFSEINISILIRVKKRGGKMQERWRVWEAVCKRTWWRESRYICIFVNTYIYPGLLIYMLL